MPFDNLSGDPAQDLLAVGIGEDLVVELAAIIHERRMI
jgi:TolB-like protein